MSKSVEFTLASGNKITIFLGNTVAVLDEDGTTRILDGLHNNGGWTVKCTYDEAIRKIKEAV